MEHEEEDSMVLVPSCLVGSGGPELTATAAVMLVAALSRATEAAAQVAPVTRCWPSGRALVCLRSPPMLS